jgi:hypothetical protein
MNEAFEINEKPLDPLMFRKRFQSKDSEIRKLQSNSQIIDRTSKLLKDGFGGYRIFKAVRKKMIIEGCFSNKSKNIDINNALDNHSSLIKSFAVQDSKAKSINSKLGFTNSFFTFDQGKIENEKSTKPKTVNSLKTPKLSSINSLREKIESQRKKSAEKINKLQSHLNDKSRFPKQIKQNYLEIMTRLEEIKLKGLQDTLKVENRTQLNTTTINKLKTGVFFLHSKDLKNRTSNNVDLYKEKMLKIYNVVNDPKVWRRSKSIAPEE